MNLNAQHQLIDWGGSAINCFGDRIEDKGI